MGWWNDHYQATQKLHDATNLDKFVRWCETMNKWHVEKGNIEERIVADSSQWTGRNAGKNNPGESTP